jgi:hypothetical protein
MDPIDPASIQKLRDLGYIPQAGPDGNVTLPGAMAPQPPMAHLPPAQGLGAPQPPQAAPPSLAQQAAAGSLPPATPRNIIATPGTPAAQPGATENQAPDPRDAALAALVAPRNAAAGRAVGVSPADKAYTDQLHEQGAHIASSIDDAVAQQAEAVRGFTAAQEQANAESKLGLAKYQEDMGRNADDQKALAQEAQESRRRIDGQLADLQAQGIDPTRYYQNQSTGQKIMGALLIGLGQFAAHPLGPHGGAPGQNVALEMMNDAARQDIEAQRVNLQKAIDVTKLRGNNAAQGFDDQMALMKAQRDSIQTTYAVGASQIDKFAARAQGNVDVQNKAAALKQAWMEHGDQWVAKTNEEIYRMKKAGEKVGPGPGGDIPKQVRELAQKIVLDSKGAVPVEEAMRQAARLSGLPDIKPGAPTTAWGKSAAANDKMSPRIVRRATDLDVAEKAAKELSQLMENGRGLPAGDRARQADAYAHTIRKAGYDTVPEHPLSILQFNMGGHRETLGTVLQQIQSERDDLERRSHGGASGGIADDNPNPAGGKEEPED